MKWVILVLFANASSCDQSTIRDINHHDKVDSLIYEASVLKKLKGNEVSRKFLDSAYTRFSEIGIMDLYKKYDYLRGNYASSYSKSDSSKEVMYIDSLFLLIDRSYIKEKYLKEYARAHLLRGDILQHQKKYNEAYNYFYRGKVMLASTFDSCLSNQFTARMASMKYREQDYAATVIFYKQAYNEVTHCTQGTDFDEMFANRQGYLSNIALCYSAMGKMDSAMYFYNQALHFIRQNEQKFPAQQDFIATARGVIFGNQAVIYKNQHKFKKAELLLKESIRINSQKGHDNKDAQFSQATLCEIYLIDNQLEKAHEALQSLRVWLDTLPHPEANLRWYNLAWKYWEKVHQIGKSQHYLKGYMVLKDSAEYAKRNFARLDQALQKMENEHELELLNKKEELNRSYLLGTIAITIMAVTIAFLIGYSWRKTRKNLNELATLNQQITSQNTQLRITLNVLERSQQENTRLIQVVAHDLRAPIGAISMAADLLLDDQTKTRKPRFFLEMIKTSSTNSLSLIDNLLQGTAKPDKKELVELQELLASCVAMVTLKAIEKKQSIDLETEVIHLFVDRQKMWRVISNILTNAIKFSQPQTTIIIRMKKMVDRVLISVKDQGIGIPAALKDSIFELFTESQRPGTWNEKPYGMGLAISRQIVEAHQGKLWFESDENRGTTFYIELPLR